MNKLSLGILSLVIIFGSCKTINPIGPSLPQSQIDTVPLQPSVINAPVSVDLTRVFVGLDQSLQSHFGQETQINGSFKYSWYINRNPINPSFNPDGSLNIQDGARWGVEVKTKNPINGNWIHFCGCDADANIGLHAQFALQNDYSLSGNVSKQSFTLGPCNVCFISFPVAPIALGIANPLIDQNLARFNQQIPKYNFANNFTPIWNTLFQTINIAGIGYLSINPIAIDISKLTGNGTALGFVAGLEAKPIISLTDPGKPNPTPLPNLAKIDGSGFNVNTDLRLQYPQLDTVINKNVDGKQIKYAKKGYVLIKNVTLSGQGNKKLIVDVVFKAKYSWITYKGHLYFTCLPVYDAKNEVLYASELDFDPATQQTLKDKGAAWILNTVLKGFLGDEIKIPINAQIDDVKHKMTAGLNRQLDANIKLAGQVSDLQVQGILPITQYLQIRANTVGTFSITAN